MKVQINVEWNGNEIITAFLEQLKQNNIEAEANDIKILVSSKDKVVEITPDRINFSYAKTKV